MKKEIIQKSFSNHSKILNSLNNSVENEIIDISNLLLECLSHSGAVFWAGNGGSASQANHLSSELLGGMYKKKTNPLKSICLNIDTAFITAWSNDDSYENIFVRQLEGLSNKGDILIVLSTSGNSSNIINAAKFAQSNSLKVVSLTGNDGGNVKSFSDINININSDNTQRIQEMHILIGHIICDIVEQSL